MTTDVIYYWTLLRERGFDPVTSFQNVMAQSCQRVNGKTEYFYEK